MSIYIGLVFASLPFAAYSQDNIGFEAGNLSGWQVCVFEAGGKDNPPCPEGEENCPACGQYTAGKQNRTMINAPLGKCARGKKESYGAVHYCLMAGAGTDENTGIPVVAPGGGKYSLRLGNREPGYQAECVQVTFHVDSNNALFTYIYAVVMESPEGHLPHLQPGFTANITDGYGQPVSALHINGGERQEGMLQQATVPACGEVWYKDWEEVTVDLSPHIGQQVTARFCTADCGLGSHFAYAYIDCKVEPVDRLPAEPGVSILYVPNAFTPNGDGNNDTFGASGKDIVEYEIYIFDRWGVLVHESTELDRKWNGLLPGNEAAPEGPYLWMINATGGDGKEYKLTGEVMLIRK